MDEWRYIGWCLLVVSHARNSKCAKFKLRNCQPVTVIANEVVNLAEMQMPSYQSCFHIDNDLPASLPRLWEPCKLNCKNQFWIKWASRLHCTGHHGPMSSAQSEVVKYYRRIPHYLSFVWVQFKAVAGKPLIDGINSQYLDLKQCANEVECLHNTGRVHQT